MSNSITSLFGSDNPSKLINKNSKINNLNIRHSLVNYLKKQNYNDNRFYYIKHQLQHNSIQTNSTLTIAPYRLWPRKYKVYL